LFCAEAQHILALALPPESPLMALFRQQVDPAAAPDAANASQGPADTLVRLETIQGVLTVAARLNEARTDADATAGLAEDIHRVLSRNLLRYWLVQLFLAILVLAAGFAVLGVVQLRNTQYNFREEISKKKDEALAGINDSNKEAQLAFEKLKAQVERTSADAAKLDGDIRAARQRVGELTVAAVKELAERDGAAVQAATNAGTAAVNAATREAVAKINAAIDIPTIKATADLAERSVKSQASQFVEEVKTRVAPAFNDTMNKSMDRLTELQGGLRAADSHAQLIDAAIKAMNVPNDDLIGRLAAYFNQTVVAVWAVLAWALLIFVFNLALCFVLVKRATRAPPAVTQTLLT
jgi:hypothetical protein